MQKEYVIQFYKAINKFLSFDRLYMLYMSYGLYPHFGK